jgi:hypothetical protein
MSVDTHDLQPGQHGAGILLARAAAAERRAGQRLRTIAFDLTARDADRLDDEARASLRAMLARLIAAVAADLGHYARRLLPSTAEAGRDDLADRLIRAGLLDDPLLAELTLRATEMRIGTNLAIEQPGEPGRAGLLPRLANSPDRLAAAAAGALMAAEARRLGDGPEAGRDDLPADLQHRLVWWVAAALRPASASAALDGALADAAQRVLAAHDEGARVEAAAERLAMALADAPDIADLIEAALADRRPALVAALVAHELGIDLAVARTMLVEPEGDRLLLALRALDLPHGTIARIAVALAEADRRRDVAGVADALDAVTSLSREEARAALATFRLPPDFRAALAALERLR